MVRYRGNGGLTGVKNTTTATGGGGLFARDEVYLDTLAGAFPVYSPPVYADAQFNYNAMLLHADGSNGANNNTFLDSSTNNYSITRNGTPTQGTFSPFSQTGWSYYNNGTASTYVTVPYTTANFDWWTTDYTIDVWIYPLDFTNWNKNTVGSPIGNVVGNMEPTAGAITNYWSFGINDTGRALLYYYNNGYNYVTSSASVNLNQWNHIGMVKTNSGVSILVNGVGTTPTAISGTPQSVATILNIGSYNGTAVNGYISNLRIVKGTAVYSGTTYTVPTAPLAAITNTKLLTLQSNRYVDNSSNALAHTVALAPNILPFSPFAPTSTYSVSSAGGSVYLDGSSSLNYGSSGSFSFTTSDFTVEAWVYLTSLGTGFGIFNVGSASAGSYSLYILNNSGYKVYSQRYGDSASAGITTNALVLNTWYHVAAVRISGTAKVYVNGVADSGATYSMGSVTNTGATTGTIWNSAYTGTGYVSGLRVTTGTGIYTTTFTPATAPVSTVSGTQLLVNGTNAGVYDSAAKNTLFTGSTAALSTTQSKFGASSMYFDGTANSVVYAPPASATANSISQPGFFGTGDFTVECWVWINAAGGYQCIATNRNSAGGVGTWFFGLYTGTTQIAWFYGGSVILLSTAVTAQTWHHVAVCRSGGTIKMFVDGALTGSSSAADTNNYNVGLVSLGFDIVENAYAYTGYIDEFRISRYARYTSAFTPSSSSFLNQ